MMSLSGSSSVLGNPNVVCFVTGLRKGRKVRGETAVMKKRRKDVHFCYQVSVVVLTSFSFVQPQLSHFCGFHGLVLA
jgi:hypothetical protein